MSEPDQVLLPGRHAMLVRLQAAEGRRPAVLDLLHRYTDGLAEEPGTEAFIVHLDPDDGDIVWIYEVFRDEDALLAHRSADGFAMLMSDMPELLAAPPGVLRLDPLRMSLQPAMLQEDLTL